VLKSTVPLTFISELLTDTYIVIEEEKKEYKLKIILDLPPLKSTPSKIAEFKDSYLEIDTAFCNFDIALEEIKDLELCAFTGEEPQKRIDNMIEFCKNRDSLSKKLQHLFKERIQRLGSKIEMISSLHMEEEHQKQRFKEREQKIVDKINLIEQRQEKIRERLKKNLAILSSNSSPPSHHEQLLVKQLAEIGEFADPSSISALVKSLIPYKELAKDKLGAPDLTHLPKSDIVRIADTHNRL